MRSARSESTAGEHIIRSDDGKVALWAGAVDDLWKLGKPRGIGGPWINSTIKSGAPSDAYLMSGFDKKSVALSHQHNDVVRFRIEADFTGTGGWSPVQTLVVKPGEPLEHKFSEAFSAYWVRVVTDQNCIATATFTYE